MLICGHYGRIACRLWNTDIDECILALVPIVLGVVFVFTRVWQRTVAR